MNTLIVWLVVLTPKQSCKEAVIAKRAAVVARIAEVARTSKDTAWIEGARQALEEVKADPQPSINYSMTDPAKAENDPCFDLYSKKIELKIKK